MTDKPTYKFDPEHYQRYSLFVEKELLERYKLLYTGKPLGSTIVALLTDFIVNAELKSEFKKLGKSK